VITKEREAKSKKDGLSGIINDRVEDLIHKRALLDKQSIQYLDNKQLIGQITVQDYYVRPTLKKTEQLLNQLQSHFA
jgi:hypothetical protein